MNILITLLIFSLPLGVLSRINILPNTYIYLHDLIAGLIFLLYLYKLLIRQTKVEHKKILYPLCIFVLIGLVSLVLNAGFLSLQQFLISLLYLIRFVVYGSILFSIQSLNKDNIKQLNVKLLLSGIIFSIFGLIQYFFYSNLRNLYYAGWDDHLYRLFSTFLDPNFAGIFLVFISLLCLGNLVISINVQDKQKAFLYGLFSILTVVCVYLTYSRSAFLSMLVGIVILIIVMNKTKLLLPVALMLFVLMFLFSNSKIEGLNPFRIASSEARLDSAKTTLSIISKNPFFGVGFDDFRYAQIRYGIRNSSSSTPSNADAGTDNAYLFIAATTGVIGLFVFLKFIFEVLLTLKNNISMKNPIRLIALSTMGALLFDTVFINSLFYPLIVVWAFMVAGITLSKKQ